MKKSVVLEDQLSRSQMPPYVWISHVARRHGEKTQRQDGDKHPPGLEQRNHACKHTLRF
jgi:hypothetical protein